MSDIEITGQMKYDCISEFRVDQLMSCEHCVDGIDEDTDSTCEQCTGAGEYMLSVPVPWTTVKNIYIKMKGLEPSPWKSIKNIPKELKDKFILVRHIKCPHGDPPNPMRSSELFSQYQLDNWEFISIPE